MKTPNLKPASMRLDLGYANRLLGMKFTQEEIKILLEKMRYGVLLKSDEIIVLIPGYRTDILHPIDLVEDIAIAYGYENFTPELPRVNTTGERDRFEAYSNSARELMLGFGFQEIMALIMTNENDLFRRMEAPIEETVVTKNPVSLEHSIARTWIIPSLMNVLEKNKNREYPQKIFEIGYCITAKGKDTIKLAGVITHSKTNFSEMKSVFTGLLENLGIDYDVKESRHGGFIPGRCASISSGFFGEIHPKVLENFGLEVPVTAFELNLNSIFEKNISH